MPLGYPQPPSPLPPHTQTPRPVALIRKATRQPTPTLPRTRQPTPTLPRQHQKERQLWHRRRRKVWVCCIKMREALRGGGRHKETCRLGDLETLRHSSNLKMQSRWHLATYQLLPQTNSVQIQDRLVAAKAALGTHSVGCVTSVTIGCVTAPSRPRRVCLHSPPT